MNRSIRFIAAATLTVATGLVAVATHAGQISQYPAPIHTAAAATGDIIQVATGPGMANVTTLVTAVKAAGLVDALKGAGPFTVFAPTNDAFAKLPPAVLADLLKPENKDKLTKILLYHVHAGEAVASTDLKAGKVTTLNGKDLTVKIDGPTIMVNGATITKTDVQATNGVIHWIDTVIVPE